MQLLPALGNFIHHGVKALERGEVVLLPTDTLYGLCADALSPPAVEKVYRLKQRNPKKPLIVLLAFPEWLDKFFGIKNPPEAAEKLFKLDIPVSIVLKVDGFDWISRGGKSVAFRVVKGGFVKEFLKSFGRPVVAPSANWEGYPPAESPMQAFLYFGGGVSVYYNGGILKGNPSALVDLTGETPKVLRRGTLREKDLQNLFGS